MRDDDIASPVARATDDAIVDQLVDHYRALRGEHPEWAEFRDAMVRERRLLARLPLTRAYGWAATQGRARADPLSPSPVGGPAPDAGTLPV